jgi:D-glycero-alpha-D-manno-heptose-7-phosphate kinase
VLFYTGQSRESASIIQRQIDNTRAGDARSLAASMALRQDAVAMKEAILRGDFAAYANVLGRSWLAKKQMASGISNAGIDAIYDAAIAAGAIAGKISGAGGGGFMMFYVPPARRMGVVRVLGDFPGQVMNFNFTGVGAHSWVM